MKLCLLTILVCAGISLSAQTDTTESIMKSPQTEMSETMAKGVTEKQKNHIYSAGKLLERGINRQFAALGLTILSTALTSVMLDYDETLAIVVGGVGFFAAIGISITGLIDMRDGSRELQSFPFD